MNGEQIEQGYSMQKKRRNFKNLQLLRKDAEIYILRPSSTAVECVMPRRRWTSCATKRKLGNVYNEA